MTSEELNALSEAELAFLLQSIDMVKSKLWEYPTDVTILKSLKQGYLKYVFGRVEPMLTDGGKVIINCVREKLKIQ